MIEVLTVQCSHRGCYRRIDVGNPPIAGLAALYAEAARVGWSFVAHGAAARPRPVCPECAEWIARQCLDGAAARR